MSSTRQSYLAVKRQASSAVAAIPTHFFRYKEGDIMLKLDVIANDPIQNNRWLALHSKPGKITSEGSYKMDLDVNECVHWIAGALGTLVTADVSSETDASVFTHTCTVANSLPYLTIEQGKGDLTSTASNRHEFQVSRAFGAMVNTLTMRGSDGLIELEVGIKAHGVFERAAMIANAAAGSSVAISLDTVEGLVATDTVNIYDTTPQNEAKAIASLSPTAKTITIATLSNSYTVAARGQVELCPLTPSFSLAGREFTFDNCDFKTGADLTAAASATEENIENWELTFENNLEERYGSLRRSPSVIAPKGNRCGIKFTKYFTSRDDLDRYLANEKRAMIINITDNVVVSATDTGNLKFNIKIELSDLRFTGHEMPTGKDDLYAYNVEAEAFYDISDARAIRITVTNGQAGTVYTA